MVCYPVRRDEGTDNEAILNMFISFTKRLRAKLGEHHWKYILQKPIFLPATLRVIESWGNWWIIIKIMSYNKSLLNFFDFRLFIIIEMVDIVINSTVKIDYILEHVLCALLIQLTDRFDWSITWRTHIKIWWVISIFDHIIFYLHFIIF